MTYYSCQECHGCGRGEENKDYDCGVCGVAVEPDPLADAHGSPFCGAPGGEGGEIDLVPR